MNEPILDIIITHWKEPWKTGQKLFDSLRIQQGISWDDVNVMLIQDGPDRKLDMLKLRGKYPFVSTSAYSVGTGISAARNTGIDLATGEWIMFCDFDDMFCSAYSLREFLTTIARVGGMADEIWSEIWEEHKGPGGEYYRVKKRFNTVFIHGRIYRREWLIRENIRFDPELCYSEDSLFNAMVDSVIDHRRIYHAQEPTYIWTLREDSSSTDPARREMNREGLWLRRTKLVDFLTGRGMQYQAGAAAWRTICDYYYEINSERELPGDPEKWQWRVWDWWQEKRKLTRIVNETDKARLMGAAREDAVSKGYCTIEKISMERWLQEMEGKYLNEAVNAEAREKTRRKWREEGRRMRQEMKEARIGDDTEQAGSPGRELAGRDRRANPDTENRDRGREV